MIFVFLLLAIVFSVSLYHGIAWGLKWLARKPFRWTNNPGNTFALVVADEDESGQGDSQRGSDVINILHGIGGMMLVKDDPNHMNWHLEEGDDPAHNTFLYRWQRIQDMGSIHYTLRKNIDRRLRFTSTDEKPEEFGNIAKPKKTKHVYYSGEMAVVVTEADTSDKLGANLDFDITFVRKFPSRSVMKLADSAAFITSRVKNASNSITVGKSADDLIGGSKTKEHREEVAREVYTNPTLKQLILDETGIEVKSVSLRDVTMTPKHRALLELQTTAEREGDAAIKKAEKAAAALIATAEGERQATIKRAEGDQFRLEHVTIPAAANTEVAKNFRTDRQAAAYENNKTVKVVGGQALVSIDEK